MEDSKLKKFFENYSLMAEPIRKSCSIEYSKQEKELERKLTLEERKDIRKEITKKFRRRAAVVGLTLATAMLSSKATATYQNQLTEAKYEGIEISDSRDVEVDASKIGDIEITDFENDFDKRIVINRDNIDETANAREKYETLSRNVTNEVLSLSKDDDTENSKEKILKYIKEMYIKEYNEKNDTEYTVEDMLLGKYRLGNEFYEDEAQNGDKIIRTREPENWQDTDNMGLLKVYIDDNVVEKGTIYKGKYNLVYDEDEIVQKAEEPSQLGEVLMYGIDYATALENKSENSIKAMETYRNRFIKSVVDYKESQIDEIIGKEDTITSESNELNNEDER